MLPQKTSQAIVCILLLAFAVASPRADESPAQITQFDGKVTVKHPKKQPKPVEPYMALHTHDTIQTGQNSWAKVHFPDKIYNLPAKCRVHVMENGLVADPDKPIRGKARRKIAATPVRSGFLLPLNSHIGEQSVSGVRLRGARGLKDELTSAAPVGAARTLPVVLRWRLHSADTSSASGAIILQVKNLDAEQTPIDNIRMAPDVREFEIPAGLLKTSTRYSWSVSGATGAEYGGMFWLLSPHDDEVIRGAEAEQKADPDNPALMQLLGEVYQHYGLLLDALEIYQKAQEKAPALPGIPDEIEQTKSLLRQYQGLEKPADSHLAADRKQPTRTARKSTVRARRGQRRR